MKLRGLLDHALYSNQVSNLNLVLKVPPPSGPVGYSSGDSPVHYYRDLVILLTYIFGRDPTGHLHQSEVMVIGLSRGKQVRLIIVGCQ